MTGPHVPLQERYGRSLAAQKSNFFWLSDACGSQNPLSQPLRATSRRSRADSLSESRRSCISDGL